MNLAVESGPLPVELVIEILEYLHYRDLLVCRLVSRWLCDMIDSSDSFQYKISLASCGMSDNPLNTSTKGHKRNLLSQHRARWLSREALPNSQNSNTKFLVSQEGPAWELVGGVLAQSKGPTTIEFVRLPSVLRGIKEETWTVDLPYSHVDFTMDPSQDLLVTVEPWNFGQREIRIHLLTMSTAKPHPSASTSIVNFDFGAVDRPQYEIRVNGPYLGLLASLWESGTISVWEWQTGELQSSMLSNDQRHLTSFVFLDDRFILIAIESDLVPSMNTISPRDGPRLEIAAFRAGDFGNWMLLFPRLCPEEDMEDMVLSCDPGSLYTPGASEVPFHVFDDGGTAGRGDRVVALNMFAIRSSSVLTVSLLLSKLVEVPSRVPDAADGIAWVEWHEWGPPAAFMDTMSSWEGLWPCIAYGTKEVILKPNGISAVKLLVKDFSQVRARWEELEARRVANDAEDALAGGGSRLRVITGEHLQPIADSLSRRRLREIFQEDVATSLWHTELEIPSQVSQRDQVMLSEDSLVVVKNGRWHAERLEVYSI